MAALSQEQIEHFINRGYVVLHDCFDSKVAKEWTGLKHFLRIARRRPQRPQHVERKAYVPSRDACGRHARVCSQGLGGRLSAPGRGGSGGHAVQLFRLFHFQSGGWGRRAVEGCVGEETPELARPETGIFSGISSIRRRSRC